MDRHRYSLAEVERALAAAPGGSSDFDLNPEWRPPGNASLRAASVLVPLVERGSGHNLILTRRAARLKHHPGQIAFPGGRQEPEDATPLAAALREAHEEIGLAPGAVRVLGSFDVHETVTRFTVTPFVGAVDPGFRPAPDRSEVDEVFEVPLDFALDPANLLVQRRRWQGAWRRYYAIPYGPHYIWGATARMLKTLGDRMHGP